METRFCADPTCATPFTVDDYHRNRQRYCCAGHGSRHRQRVQRARRWVGAGICQVCGGVCGPRSFMCRADYLQRYRLTPSGKAATYRANKAYERRNPAKRLVWVHNYRARIGWYNPDLQELRRALKRVEQALAQATRRQGLRGSGQ